MIEHGVMGMTSNPTIFDKAVSGSSLYDSQINDLAQQGTSIYDIYDAITIKDIQDAADVFRPVYEESNGLDGYVSLEINPYYANDGKKTVSLGKELKSRVNRPNVMFKVPGTAEGNFAIEELTAAGVNVNVTLLFSRTQYERSAAAYIRGIERFIEQGGAPQKLRSVASIFVSRIDAVVDAMIDEKIKDWKLYELVELKGKAAAANCALCYEEFLRLFGKEFSLLSSKGANIQRILWGSTGTKNPIYSDIKYVTELIAKDTVSTMPEHTLRAFLEHGAVFPALPGDIETSAGILNSLAAGGIDIDGICERLQKDGVDIFIKAFDSLVKSVETKSRLVVAS
jgi:transaldolase